MIRHKIAHTSGPWRVGEDDFEVVDAAGLPLALMGGGHRDFTELAANARLVCLAPEMLDALKALLYPNHEGDIERYWKAIENARAIIAKVDSA